MEVLALSITQNNNDKSIKIGDIVLKVSQLADDMLCLVEDIPSVQSLLESFCDRGNISGLKVNLNKTSATYIGTIHQPLPDISTIWEEKPINTLCVPLEARG